MPPSIFVSDLLLVLLLLDASKPSPCNCPPPPSPCRSPAQAGLWTERGIALGRHRVVAVQEQQQLEGCVATPEEVAASTRHEAEVVAAARGLCACQGSSEDKQNPREGSLSGALFLMRWVGTMRGLAAMPGGSLSPCLLWGRETNVYFTSVSWAAPKPWPKCGNSGGTVVILLRVAIISTQKNSVTQKSHFFCNDHHTKVPSVSHIK